MTYHLNSPSWTQVYRGSKFWLHSPTIYKWSLTVLLLAVFSYLKTLTLVHINEISTAAAAATSYWHFVILQWRREDWAISNLAMWRLRQAAWISTTCRPARKEHRSCSVFTASLSSGKSFQCYVWIGVGSTRCILGWCSNVIVMCLFDVLCSLKQECQKWTKNNFFKFCF